MTKGTHGSTFGGNPLAVAVGTAVINEIMSKDFLEKVDKVARYLWKELISLQKYFNEIVEASKDARTFGIVEHQNSGFAKCLQEAKARQCSLDTTENINQLNLTRSSGILDTLLSFINFKKVFTERIFFKY